MAVQRTRRVGAGFAGALLVMAAAGCYGEPRSEAVATSSAAIVRGEPSTPEDDAVVLVSIEHGGRTTSCSGVLVAKNLVLTAHHCVGKLEPDATISEPYPASALSVFAGVDATARRARRDDPAARVRRVFTVDASRLIPDVAYLLLDRDVEARVAAIRLDGGARQGETFTVVGFGIDTAGREDGPRTARTGALVTRRGPGMSRYHQLFEGEFVAGEATCTGDSGAPAFGSVTRAVIGVASRVENGTERSEERPASFCVGADVETVYTAVSTTSALAREAFAAASASPVIEVPQPNIVQETLATDPPPAEAPPSAGCAIARSIPSPAPLAGGAVAMAAVFATARRRRVRSGRR